MELETCANCGRKIGKLEEPGAYKNHIVCPECYERLAKQRTAVTPPMQPSATPIPSYYAPQTMQTGVATMPAPLASERAPEQLIFQTRHHPIVFVRAAVYTVFWIIIFVLIAIAYLPILVIPAILLPLYWLNLVLYYFSSRFVVTSRRVTMKMGFLSRRSFELLVNKVESIQVQQGFIERMYGGGSLVISGTGGTKEIFPDVSDPVGFQKAVQSAAATY